MITAELIPDLELGGFTARLPDIPAYGEGETEEAALADLKEALLAFIEAYGIEETLGRINSPTALRQLDWNLAEMARG